MKLQASPLYVPALVCVVPLRFRSLLRFAPPTPVAVPAAVWGLVSKVTVYGVTAIVAVAAVMEPVPLALVGNV